MSSLSLIGRLPESDKVVSNVDAEAASDSQGRGSAAGRGQYEGIPGYGPDLPPGRGRAYGVQYGHCSVPVSS
jgi:hypothetical protein